MRRRSDGASSQSAEGHECRAPGGAGECFRYCQSRSHTCGPKAADHSGDQRQGDEGGRGKVGAGAEAKDETTQQAGTDP